MKNFLFLIISIYLFASCNNIDSNKEDEITNKSNQLMSPKEIAQYHNLILSDYLQSKKTKAHTQKNFIEAQNEILILMQDKYQSVTTGYSSNVLTSYQQNYFSETMEKTASEESVEYDFKIYFKEGMNQAASQGKISQKFANDIVDITLNSSSYSSIIAYIDEYAKNENISETERYSLEVYKEVLLASNGFWTSYENGDKRLKLKGGAWAIIADGAGGLLGALALNPISTIVVSTAASAITNEMLE